MIVVNGEPRELTPGTSLAGVLEALGVAPSRRGVAVAVDGEVVPRGAWDATPLAEGARIEVVHAIQGG